MAYDYENYKKFYNAMNDTQRAKWAESNKNDADFNDFMSRYNSDSNATKSYVTPKQSNYQSQGEGNYVYNEKTGYYENQTNTSKNTVNQGIAPRPETKQETIIKETPVKQEETVITTDTKNNQRGALTPASNEYYQQTSDEALNKIRNNLNQYRQTNPEYFSDYDSFKKNFSYDLRNDEQKNVLDTWYTGYSKGLELSATPIADLYTQYQNGEISINDLENLRISNPTKYSELTAQINKGNIISAYDDDKGTDKMNIQEMAYEMAAQTFKAFMEGGSGASSIFSEYEEKMNDPEMLALGDQCTEYEAEIEQIQDDIASMKKQVEREYEGTGASRAKINAIIADRTYDLQLQLRTANSNYNKVANQYNNRMQQYQQEYTMKLQEYQLNMQERKAQMDELGFAMDLMNFETNEQKQQRERDYWVKQQQYQNGDINSSDYQTRYKAALKSVENLLSQYEGIPMIRSAEQMAEDILKGIDQNGTTLGEELSKINKQIQQKDEYKFLYNQAYKPATSASSGIGETIKIGDQEYVKYNGERYTAEDFNRMFSNGTLGTGKAKDYTVVDESLLENSLRSGVGQKNLGRFLAQSKNMNGSKGGQCGKFVNDYLQSIGVTGAANRYYDNDLSTKLNSINAYSPKVGSIAVFDYGYKSKSDNINHGHVGIVTKVYSDGSFDMRDSNGDLSKPETIRTIHVTPSDSLKGFFDPSKPPLSSSSTTTDNKQTSTSSNAFTTAGNNIALGLGSVSATNTFNEQLQTYLNNGDYTSAFEYITTQAKRSTDSDTKSAINSAESAISALVSIRDGLEAYKTAGGDTNIFAGTTEQVANKIGKTTDPQLKKLATQINVAIQNYRKAISGAAFSESEAAEYAAIFPSTKNDKELNDALIDGALQTMLQNLNSNYAQILGTQTYTDLLQSYQDNTGDIYNYYGNKQSLTKYLKDNGYMNTGSTKKTTTKTGARLGSQATTTSTGNSGGTLKKASVVVEPNMSEYQSSTTNDLGNGLLSKTVNGITLYSYDGGKTWN